MITPDNVVAQARAWRVAHNLAPILRDRDATEFRAMSLARQAVWLDRVNPEGAKVFRAQAATLLRNAGSIFMEDLVRETIAGIFTFVYPATRWANGENITIQGGARGAQAFQYAEMDRTGLDPATGLVPGDSDEIEEVSLEGSRKLQEYATHMRAFSWSLDDLETAQLQGAFDLIDEKRSAVRKQLDEDFESYIVNGVAGKWPSVFAMPGSLAVAATTGTWSGATSAQIVADVADVIAAFREHTNGVLEPTKALFSATQWGLLELPYGPEGANSRLSLLQRTYPMITSWGWDRHLAAGQAFFYANTPDVIACRAPFRFEFLPPEATAAKFRVVCRNRLSGPYSKQPRGLCMLKGL